MEMDIAQFRNCFSTFKNSLTVAPLISVFVVLKFKEKSFKKKLSEKLFQGNLKNGCERFQLENSTRKLKINKKREKEN